MEMNGDVCDRLRFETGSSMFEELRIQRQCSRINKCDDEYGCRKVGQKT